MTRRKLTSEISTSYRYKVEASVQYPGIAIHLSSHYVGSTSDVTIFTERRERHLRATAKSDSEQSVDDMGEGAT
jgi:hypothetical protein